MSDQFEFLSASDKPALIAFSTPEWLEEIKKALQELGYKVHTAATHSEVRIARTNTSLLKNTTYQRSDRP
mgnify:CR=1 FL=1